MRACSVIHIPNGLYRIKKKIVEILTYYEFKPIEFSQIHMYWDETEHVLTWVEKLVLKLNQQ